MAINVIFDPRYGYAASGGTPEEQTNAMAQNAQYMQQWQRGVQAAGGDPSASQPMASYQEAMGRGSYSGMPPPAPIPAEGGGYRMNAPTHWMPDYGEQPMQPAEPPKTVREILREEYPGGFDDGVQFSAALERAAIKSLKSYGQDMTTPQGRQLFEQAIAKGRAEAAQPFSPWIKTFDKSDLKEMKDEFDRPFLYDIRKREAIYPGQNKSQQQAAPLQDSPYMDNLNAPPPAGGIPPGEAGTPQRPMWGNDRPQDAAPQNQLSDVGSTIAKLEAEILALSGGDLSRIMTNPRLKGMWEMKNQLVAQQDRDLSRAATIEASKRKKVLSESQQAAMMGDMDAYMTPEEKVKNLDEEGNIKDWKKVSQAIGDRKRQAKIIQGPVGKQLAVIEGSYTMLDILDQKLKEMEKAGITGAIKGRLTSGASWASLGKFYPEIQAYNDVASGMTARLKGVTGDTGVMTENDYARIYGLIGKITDDPARAKEKLDTIREILDSNLKIQYKNNRIDPNFAQYQMGSAKPAPAAPAAQAAGGGAPVAVSSKAEYDALPSGTEYISADGSVKRKK